MLVLGAHIITRIYGSVYESHNYVESFIPSLLYLIVLTTRQSFCYFYNTHARSSCYNYNLMLMHLILLLFIGANTWSEASPLPSISNGIDYELPSEELLNLEGPLLCHGNLTVQSPEPQDYSLFCDGGIFCQGITSCNDTLVCSRDWVDLNGTLICNGELFCNGTLNCNKGPAHPACLPGLGRLPPPALAILMVFLIVTSGGLSGLKSAFMSNFNFYLQNGVSCTLTASITSTIGVDP